MGSPPEPKPPCNQPNQLLRSNSNVERASRIGAESAPQRPRSATDGADSKHVEEITKVFPTTTTMPKPSHPQSPPLNTLPPKASPPSASQPNTSPPSQSPPPVAPRRPPPESTLPPPKPPKPKHPDAVGSNNTPRGKRMGYSKVGTDKRAPRTQSCPPRPNKSGRQYKAGSDAGALVTDVHEA